MGVFHAENFQDLDRSSIAAYSSSQLAKGLSNNLSGTTMLNAVTLGALPAAANDAEQRNWAMHQIRSVGTGNSWTVYAGIPVPAAPYYMSCRVYLGTEVATGAAWPFILSTTPLMANGSIMASVSGTDKSLRVGGTTTATGVVPSTYDPAKIFTLEIYHAADNSYKVWFNDIPQTVTGTAPQPNGFIYFGAYRNGTIAAAAGTNFNIYINDIVVVDPSTPGLQYRTGQTARVESMDFTADQTAQWALPSGVTGNHYPIMNLPFRGTVPDTEKLTSLTIGAEELYAAASLRTDLGSLVYAVELEGAFANTAGSAHVLTLNGNFNSAGKIALKDLTIPIGGSPQYTRFVMDKNPNGNVDWTLAAATAPKVGYAIKS